MEGLGIVGARISLLKDYAQGQVDVAVSSMLTFEGMNGFVRMFPDQTTSFNPLRVCYTGYSRDTHDMVLDSALESPKILLQLTNAYGVEFKRDFLEFLARCYISGLRLNMAWYLADNNPQTLAETILSVDYEPRRNLFDVLNKELGAYGWPVEPFMAWNLSRVELYERFKRA
jgi:hypothetical protein